MSPSFRTARGFTLIELMTALAVFTIAVAGATLLMMQGASMSRDAEQTLLSQDNATIAGAMITDAIEKAGTGGFGGVYAAYGSTGVSMSPVYGRDAQTPTPATDLPDDLWVVVPDRNAFGETCTTSPGLGGQSQVITADAAASAALTLLPCTVNTFSNGDLLLATHFVSSAPPPNTWSGALMSGTVFSGMNLNTYNEQAITGFADTPYGFKKGDMVFRARAYHFYVALDPKNNIPTLFRQPAKPGGTGSPGPLTDDTTQPATLVPYIDDLQVQFGLDTNLTGDPSQYTFQSQLPTCTSGTGFWCASTALRSVRVSVVGRSPKSKRDFNVNTNTTLGPLPVDNHTTVGTGNVGGVTGDGLARTIFTERVELPSMAPANL